MDSKDYSKRYYEKNREKILNKKKKYYEKNKDDIIKKSKEYRDSHPYESSAKKRIYYLNNISKFSLYNKLNYQKGEYKREEKRQDYGEESVL